MLDSYMRFADGKVGLTEDFSPQRSRVGQRRSKRRVF
jgi:hypothetical protein